MDGYFNRGLRERIIPVSKQADESEDVQLMLDKKRKRDEVSTDRKEIVNRETLRNSSSVELDTDVRLSRAKLGFQIKKPGGSEETARRPSLPRTLLTQTRAKQPEHNSHLLRRSTRKSGIPSYMQDDIIDTDIPAKVERFSVTHGLGNPWCRPLSYPRTGKNKATVEWEDLERLDEGEFLNDNLISFYLRFLEHKLEQERPEIAKRVYFFNSFFYERLTAQKKGSRTINYEGVQKWTRTIDLFTYDVVIVPINEMSHWYVAVLCNLPALDRKLALSEESVTQSDPLLGDSITLTDPIDENFSQEQKSETPAKDTTQSFAEMSLDNGDAKARKDETFSTLR